MSETINNAATIHKFEAAGLGKAPFRFVGISEQSVNASGLVKIGEVGGCEMHTTPGGTCDYCGMAIMVICNVVSADGKRFHVGSDCIGKIGDAGLQKVVKKEINKRNTEKRHAREKAKIAAGVAKLGAARATLATLPHKNDYFAKQGKTLADWVDWMLSNGGTAGKLAAVAEIEKYA